MNGINSGSTTSIDLSDRPFLDVSSTSVYDDPLAESNKPDQDDTGRLVSGPAIPSSSNDMIWNPHLSNQNQNPPQINNEIVAGPSTNPMLNSNQLMPMFPPISRSPSSEPFGGNSNQIDLSTMNNDLKSQQPDYLSQNPNSMFGATSEKRSIGVATVISFVLVSILVFLGFLFAISSYRLRHQPKLGPPPSISQARHLVNGSGSTTATGKSGLVNPSLQSFMNVFSSSPPSTLPVGATAAAATAAATNQLDSHYNAIFATNERSLNNSNDSNNAMRATLKKLATLTGSSSSRKLKNKQKHHQANNLFNHHQPSNQLLVSVKESSGNQLFGNQATSGKGQAINTQLIVGFNQANPLAQQQIYNNSSNLNCSNQTYATHYSTSMSMASSSTNGHQGDYDYAIPDAQPIIPSSQQQHLHQSAMSPLVSIHHHHEHHLNHAFNSNTNNFRHPTSTINNNNNNFNYQTELRASHRGGVGDHLGHQTTLVHQAQQAMQQPLRPTEHNYELINQDQAHHQANVRPSLPNPHHRTLSNQLMTCQSQQQSQQAPFSATTLNTSRLINHNNNEQIKRILPQVMTAEEASPGGNSSQSVSTTTTSASGNNSMDIQGGHYYYSANEQQQQQQLKSGAQNNKQQRLNR